MSDALRESDWELEAACKGTNTDEFFVSGSQPSKMIQDMCKHCPVRTECLESALEEERATHSRWGYRGGKSPVQRKSIYVARTKAKRQAEQAAQATRRQRRPDSESTYS